MTSGQCGMATGQVNTNTLRLRAKTGSSIPAVAASARERVPVAFTANRRPGAPPFSSSAASMRPLAERSKPSTRSRTIAHAEPLPGAAQRGEQGVAVEPALAAQRYRSPRRDRRCSARDSARASSARSCSRTGDRVCPLNRGPLLERLASRGGREIEIARLARDRGRACASARRRGASRRNSIPKREISMLIGVENCCRMEPNDRSRAPGREDSARRAVPRRVAAPRAARGRRTSPRRAAYRSPPRGRRY